LLTRLGGTSPNPPPTFGTLDLIADKISGRPSNYGAVLSYDPVMGCTTSRRALLGFYQPMQRLRGGKFDTVRIALSTINRFGRLAPA
jgi:hypothetical protein